MAAGAIRHSLDDIDAATIRLRAPRAFTQSVSRFVYERGALAGIRYGSRLGDDLFNWAIFEPGPGAQSLFLATTVAAIDLDHADLRRAFDLLGLTLGCVRWCIPLPFRVRKLLHPRG